MALNENLQNVINDLKDAKTTIASALSNIDGIDANSGLGTIAEQVNGSTSIYDTSDAASGNKSKVLDGITFYDQLGSQTGTMSQYTHSAPDIQYNSSTKKIDAVNYDSTKSGYFPSVGNTARYSEILPADLEPNKNLKAENIKSGVSIFGVNGSASSAKTYTITGTNSYAVSDLVIYNDICAEIYSYMEQGAILNVQLALTPIIPSITYASLAFNYFPMRAFMGSTTYATGYCYLIEYRQTANSVYFSGPNFGYQTLWGNAFTFPAVPRSHNESGTVTAWYNWPVGTYNLTATLIIP